MAVVYLTTRRVPSPEVSSSRSRHVFFDDLHRRLLKANARLTAEGRLFVAFMEENGMESEEPFTEADVRVARHAFRVAKKCRTAIDKVVAGIEPRFKKRFHTRARFTRAHFDAIGAYAYTQNLRWRGLGRLEISIFIEPDAGELAFGVSAKVRRGNVKKLNRALEWDEGDGEVYTWHPISGRTDSGQMIPKVWDDLKGLRGGLNRAF